MARTRIVLDYGGVGEVLRSAEVAGEIASLAESVAANARGYGTVQRHSAEVRVDTYETDRAAAAVTIAHAGGLGMEAKYGVLGGSAGAVGLQVRSGS